MGTGVASSELLSVSFQPLVKEQILKGTCLLQPVPLSLETFSPGLAGHRYLPTSDKLEKRKCYTHNSLSIGLKNMAKPHDLLVQIS